MAAAAVTLRDVLFAYLTARRGYERFKDHHGCNAEQARNSMALMLWVDQGHGHVTRHVPALTTDAFDHLVHEIRTMLDLLHTNVLVLPPMPLISALGQEGGGVDLVGTFAYDPGFIVRALAGVLDGPVAKLVFDDRLYRAFDRHQTGLLGRHTEIELPYVTPPPPNVPEDFRSMFITFSRGQSVERDEVFNYFRHKWGDCIVRVLLEKTNGGMPPMYGRIIFRSEAFVSLALNGVERVSIFIRDREIWLRKYIPRPNNNNNN
ncbi:unnamed protein product [Urochloa decumbens]|uniref:Uncharacterized protein n=1 Tax=Urochloa decumbens TaxID=240449 RepID=A0ABC8VK57_9POAL